MKRYEIDFKYADEMSNYEWRDQSCSLYADNPEEAKKQCIKLYGLGVDCDYVITSIREYEYK